MYGQFNIKSHILHINIFIDFGGHVFTRRAGRRCLWSYHLSAAVYDNYHLSYLTNIQWPLCTSVHISFSMCAQIGIGGWVGRISGPLSWVWFPLFQLSAAQRRLFHSFTCWNVGRVIWIGLHSSSFYNFGRLSSFTFHTVTRYSWLSYLGTNQYSSREAKLYSNKTVVSTSAGFAIFHLLNDTKHDLF